MPNFSGKMKFNSDTYDYGENLAILKSEDDHLKRFAILEEHIVKFISGDTNWDDTYTLLPIFKITYEELLQRNNQVANEPKDHINEPEKLNELVDNLEILLKYLVVLCSLSDYFISKDELKIGVLKSLPVCLTEVIRLIFAHYQDSVAIYNNNYIEHSSNYKDLIDILRKLLETARDIHAKLIKILFDSFKVVTEFELAEFTEVLNALANLSKTLMYTDFKLCAETWNALLSLIKKHVDRVEGLFNFDKPLRILMEFSLNGLETIYRDYETIFKNSELSEQTTNIAVSHFKEHRFIIKVIIKLYQKMSMRNSDCYIFWIYFIQLFRFSEPIMILRKLNQKLIDLMNEYIFEVVQPLLCAIVRGFKFQVITNPSNELLKASIKSGSGILLLINSILLSTKIHLDSNDILDVVKASFTAIMHCKCTDFFQHKIVISSNDINHDLYSELLVNLTCYLLTLPKDSYAIAEAMIIRNIFSETFCLGLFAMDLFILIIRHTNPLYSYDVICDVIDRTFPLVVATHTDTRDQYRLSSLLRMLYSQGSLDETMRFKLLTKYPLPSMPGPWRHLGLLPIQKPKGYVQGMMLEYAEKTVDDFSKGKLAGVHEFIKMIQYLEIVSSIPHDTWSPTDISKLRSFIGKLWIFNDDNLVLLHDPLFTTYLTVSINFTTKNLESIDGDQIKKIIDKIATITAADQQNNDKINFFAILLLSKCIKILSTKKDLAAVLEPSTAAKLLNGIFSNSYDNYDFIKREAVAVIKYADKSMLRHEIMEFGRSTDASAGVTPFHGLYSENIRFGSHVEFLQHICIDWSAVADNDVCPLPGPSSSSVGCAVGGIANAPSSPPQIREKGIRAQMDDVTKALNCIKNDVKVLKAYHKTYKFSQKNVSGIFNIMDDLKQLV